MQLALPLSSPTPPPQVAPTKVRGTLGSLNQLMICLGILGALLVNVALPVTAWRNMFMVAVAPAVILFVGERRRPGDAVVGREGRRLGSSGSGGDRAAAGFRELDGPVGRDIALKGLQEPQQLPGIFP
jgi:MFS family permease